jgi:hypothetical protein
MTLQPDARHEPTPGYVSKGGIQMRFWFLLAAVMGPRFFRRFIFLFALGMALMVYLSPSSVEAAQLFGPLATAQRLYDPSGAATPWP